jgi:hypothetical protein
MSITLSEESWAEFNRWKDQFFQQWRDEIAARQVRFSSFSLENPPEQLPKPTTPPQINLAEPSLPKTLAPPPCKDPEPITAQPQDQPHHHLQKSHQVHPSTSPAINHSVNPQNLKAQPPSSRFPQPSIPHTSRPSTVSHKPKGPNQKNHPHR